MDTQRGRKMEKHEDAKRSNRRKCSCKHRVSRKVDTRKNRRKLCKPLCKIVVENKNKNTTKRKKCTRTKQRTFDHDYKYFTDVSRYH